MQFVQRNAISTRGTPFLFVFGCLDLLSNLNVLVVIKKKEKQRKEKKRKNNSVYLCVYSAFIMVTGAREFQKWRHKVIHMNSDLQ